MGTLYLPTRAGAAAARGAKVVDEAFQRAPGHFAAPREGGPIDAEVPLGEPHPTPRQHHPTPPGMTPSIFQKGRGGHPWPCDRYRTVSTPTVNQS